MDDGFGVFIVAIFIGLFLGSLIGLSIKGSDVKDLCTEFKIESKICEEHMDKLGYK